MTVQITPQLIIATGAVLGALTAIITLLFKFVRWFDRQKAQDIELKEIKAKHEEDIKSLKQMEARDIADMKNEQQLLTYGILACLKGLKEQGCNGPVTEAINKIEKHLNQRAHE